VDAALRNSEALSARVREVHPEVCCFFWNASQPMQHRKRTIEGARERKALIEQAFGPTAFESVRARHRPGMVADDDVAMDGKASCPG
jgi:predicted RNase H-like nuclease